MAYIPESKQHIEDEIKARSDEAWTYTFPIRNQNYVVMSIVENTNTTTDTDSTPTKNRCAALKVFGVYGGLEEANRASATISKENDFFDVYVADTNAWVPIPPTREFVENIEYQEKKMTEIQDSFTALKERNAKNLAASIKKDTRAPEAISESPSSSKM